MSPWHNKYLEIRSDPSNGHRAAFLSPKPFITIVSSEPPRRSLEGAACASSAVPSKYLSSICIALLGGGLSIVLTGSVNALWVHV